MKKIILGVVLLVLCFSLAYAQSKGKDLFSQAEKEFGSNNYDKAHDLYIEARKEFLQEGDPRGAKDALIRKFQIMRILCEYSYPKEKAEEYLAKKMKQFTAQERKSWLESGKADFMVIEGEPFYFVNFDKNLAYRYPEIMKRLDLSRGKEATFLKRYHSLIFGKKTKVKSWQPYINPVTFRVKGSVSIPKAKLPKKGILKIWVPLPIQTAAQDNIRIISVLPEKYLMMPPKTEGELGNLYMEIPAEEIKTDLNIEVNFEFRHFQQSFTFDANNVGEYDKESDLYKRYTRSYRNTAVSEDIINQAKSIVQDQANPYLCAKKIYNYVVGNVNYSLMPHLTLDILKKAESLYVHEHKYGDCGAQSIYFVSLCRALGIPARTTGGWQLCPGKESPHFWAEFYLPNYGWIPVDTSIAQTAAISQNAPAEECRIFEDYFFGSQDPYRFVIQKDVDIAPYPEPDERLYFTLAIQYPFILCDTSEEDLTLILIESWKFKFNRFPGRG